MDGLGLVIALVLLAGVVFVGLQLFRSSRTDRRLGRWHLREARAEVRQQMESIANDILAFSDDPDTADHAGAAGHFRRASGAFARAELRLKTAKSHVDLEELSNDLDVAAWEMEAAQALVRGEGVSDPPPVEEMTRCFFDPTHRAGIYGAEIHTATGRQPILVCGQCRDRLAEGEVPDPRMVRVARDWKPVANAPRSYGGRNMHLGHFRVGLVGSNRDATANWS